MDIKALEVVEQTLIKNEGFSDRHYIWDSLGMVIKTPPPEKPRASEICWHLSHYADYSGENALDRYKRSPKLLVPEPLDLEKCGILLFKNMRFKKLLSSTDCFYESVLHGSYKTAGYTDNRPGAFQSIYYYADSEVYDMAENKTPYAVVREFSVSADD